MVMTEAIAVGPGVDLANGSGPEVVVDGETGFMWTRWRSWRLPWTGWGSWIPG
jgi:hypothetical protein